MMPLRKGRYFSFYLFILVSLTTFSNQNLNTNFFNLNRIEILGLENQDLLNFEKEIININLRNLLTINKNYIKDTIDSNNSIETYEIFKNYPASLIIKLNKTNYIARIKINNFFFLIGTNGKFIKDDLSNKDLPFIFGSPSIREILNFISFINEANFNYNNIKYLYYFRSGRWDIETKDGKIFKLPKENLFKRLKEIINISSNENFQNKMIIDVRIKNHIVAND